MLQQPFLINGSHRLIVVLGEILQEQRHNHMPRLETLHYKQDLKELHLPTVRNMYPDFIKQAERESLGYSHFLFELIEQECQTRRNNKITRLLRESRLPLEKNLETFDLTRLPKKVVQQVRSLLDGGFLDRRENILVFGNPGSGKTHLLCSIAQEAVLQGRRIYFSTSALLVHKLLLAKRDLQPP